MYCKLLSNASGPEIADLLDLSGPLLAPSPLEKVGGPGPRPDVQNQSLELSMNREVKLSLSEASSAELPHGAKKNGASSKRAEIGPESFGIVVCRSGGTVLDISGLVWPSFKP